MLAGQAVSQAFAARGRDQGVFNAELMQRVVRFVASVGPMCSCRVAKSRTVCYAPASIQSDTGEILRNTFAERALGLPR